MFFLQQMNFMNLICITTKLHHFLWYSFAENRCGRYDLTNDSEYEEIVVVRANLPQEVPNFSPEEPLGAAVLLPTCMYLVVYVTLHFRGDHVIPFLHIFAYTFLAYAFLRPALFF